MNAEAIRLRLRVLESRGDIRSWWEKRAGTYVVTIGAGPAMIVHHGRDIEALEGILARKAAPR